MRGRWLGVDEVNPLLELAPMHSAALAIEFLTLGAKR